MAGTRKIRDESGLGLGSESPPVLMRPKPSRGLMALTSSALALPGIAGSASADAPIERAEALFAASYYAEDDLSPNKFKEGVGSRERYEIYTAQLRFDLPVSERVDLGLQFLYEEMSGASPWYVVAGTASGELLQVMSGATIEDERLDVSLDLDYYLETGKDTFSGGISHERDYFAAFGGIGAERNFNEKNTTFSASGAFSYDWVRPTDRNFTSIRRLNGEKWSLDFFAGLSQVLTPSALGQITINYKHSDGFLDDPYKLINDTGGTTLSRDVRPSKKDQVSLLFRLRQHIEPVNASVHIDYQIYTDSFDITSHSLDLAWHQSVGDWLTLTPSLRYYSQSKADFYQPVLASGSLPKRRSSDYRLSPYGAVSLRFKAEMHFVDLFRYDPSVWLQRFGFSEGFDLTAALSYERYLSDGNYAIEIIEESDEAPGLVKFQVISFSIGGRF